MSIFLQTKEEAMRFGYARVSTQDQSLETQIEQLKREGVDENHIFCEKRSGVKDRPQLKKLLGLLQEGDELHITKLDRLGRSLRERQAFADELQERGVSLCFNGATYNPKDPFSKLVFDLLSVFADFERNLIALRTSERLAAMKEQGIRVGRKRSTTPEQEELIVRLHVSGYSNAELLATIGGGQIHRNGRDAIRELRIGGCSGLKTELL